MKQSIYLMGAVPYLALGIVGFGVYRGLKKIAEYAAKRRLEQGAEFTSAITPLPSATNPT